MSITGASLDHVAVAVERWELAWPRYVGQLGGRWRSGGSSVGFAPAQLLYANQAKLELLAPHDWERNPFLRRFLDRSGPGPHHLTFIVANIEQALGEARRAGLEPVNVDLSDPEWREAFLHPRQATGIVVQLAQAAGSWEAPAPADFPVPHRQPAALHHVAHAVADLDGARALFVDLLGGTVAAEGAGPGPSPSTGSGASQPAGSGGWRYVELTWSGPLRIRLVAPEAGGAPNPVDAWLGGRAGRLHHLAFTGVTADVVAGLGGAAHSHTGTGPVPGVIPGDPEPAAVVEPDDNLGVRLVLSATGAPVARGGSGGEADEGSRPQ